MNRWLVQHAIVPLHEALSRRRTLAVRRRLERSQWFTREQLHELQLRKLRSLVGAALERTEFYAEFAGVAAWWRPNTLEDLRRLPLLDKDAISDHREQLTNRQAPGGVIRYRTGGSSGKPLIFYIDRRRQAYDKAARIRTHTWWQIGLGDREAYIWNAPVELNKQDRVKRVRDRLINEQLFAASELSPQSIGGFVDALRRFRPDCLFGYPSAISLLCALARDAGLTLDDLPVRVVFSTAEVLYEHQKRMISESFGGAKIADGYGSREAGFIAHECPEGRMHITSENVIVEVVRDGRPVGCGEDGEIVVTQLDNFALPFIRYRTGDVGQLSDERCPCGRGLEIMKVVKGRSNDFLIAPDGHWVHGSAVHAALSGIPGIVNFQLRQGADRHVRILLVTDGQFPADGESKLLAGIRGRLGPGGSAAVEYRRDIPPGPAGKHRYVISELSTLTHDGKAPISPPPRADK